MELRSRLKKVSDAATARKEWDAFRASAKSTNVIVKLNSMLGFRHRCAYCSDSAGSDVDHFQPITSNWSSTFEWQNIFYICGNCNRRKLHRWKTNPTTGKPLLIRPDKEQPWRFLYLDTQTGLISPRFQPETFNEDPRASFTLEVLPVLNFEATIQGRLREIRLLNDACTNFISRPNVAEWTKLLVAFTDEQMGIKAWFTRYEGVEEDLWSQIRAGHKSKWRRLVGISF